MFGRVGRTVFGEDGLPGMETGPPLRRGVGSIDGGLVGRTELASAGEAVMT